MEAEPKEENVDEPISQAPKEDHKEHHETIYDILMDQDEITWQSIIMELIKSEQMDPWDINVSLLSQKFIQTLKKLKEMNLRLSGKILLAAALLLRIKSSRLVGEDMMEFDRLLASGEHEEDIYGTDEEFVEGELGNDGLTIKGMGDWKLIPKTPQPRKRKVSAYDLIDALAIALNVRRRRILNKIEPRPVHRLPDKQIDITKLMDDLHKDVLNYLDSGDVEKVAFSDLLPEECGKHGKVLTFIPLLHLTNARETDLEQHDHFGEIWVKRVTEETKRIVEEQLKKEAEEEEKKEAAEKKKKSAARKKRMEAKKRREEKERLKAEKNAEKQAVRETKQTEENPETVENSSETEVMNPESEEISEQPQTSEEQKEYNKEITDENTQN